VNCKEQQIAHELHTITPANLRKTAPQGLFALHFYEFAPNRSHLRMDISFGYIMPWFLMHPFFAGVSVAQCVC
jgi:hypothetical protein